MKVYLDGQEVVAGEASLGSALAAGCRVAEASGRIVVEAELDGRPLSPEQLSSAESVGSADGWGGELRLVSAEPRSLVLTTFLDVADALEAVKGEQVAAAELIQVGKTEEALERLAGALGVWEQARQAVANGCALLQIPLETQTAGPGGEGATVARRADMLAGSLEEVRRSIQAGDWTGLADVLMYDMEGQAESWRGMLTDLASMVRSAREVGRETGQGGGGGGR